MRNHDFSLKINESNLGNCGFFPFFFLYETSKFYKIKEEHEKDLKVSNNIYEVVIDGQKSIKLDLVFCPKEV